MMWPHVSLLRKHMNLYHSNMHTTTPVHVAPRARKRIVLSDDDEDFEEEVVAVSALSEYADDDEMPLDAPVRGSEAMGSNGDVLEAIASTSRATRSRNRAVRSTPYQRVQALRWDSACPLLHLALARAKLWATTNH